MRAFFKSKTESPGESRLSFGAYCLRASLPLLLCLIAAACAQRHEPSASGRAFADEIGREIKVTEHPQRIVSLAPSVTETLFALGLGDRVVGVTSYCDYPPEAAEKEKVGDTLRPSIERIVALKPDLVVASTASQLEQFVRDLDKVGIPVYVSNPRDLEGVLRSIGMIGDITRAGDRAEGLTGDMRARVNAIESRMAGIKQRPKVLFVLGVEPLITVGGASFINEMISRAGGDSVSAGLDAEYPTFSLETAVASRPEVIFFQAGGEKLPEWLKGTPAARSGRVFHIDDNLLLRPGPRIVDGLEQMASRIHPELFAAQ
ncbi:MAG TPA: cobalamin-binding protein [Blastocatellia bacterium]|nr:cobalamin-binding protein [Blastocatellia bacterium]